MDKKQLHDLIIRCVFCRVALCSLQCSDPGRSPTCIQQLLLHLTEFSSLSTLCQKYYTSCGLSSQTWPSGYNMCWDVKIRTLSKEHRSAQVGEFWEASIHINCIILFQHDNLLLVNHSLHTPRPERNVQRHEVSSEMQMAHCKQ